jgi:hypothetical protein
VVYVPLETVCETPAYIVVWQDAFRERPRLGDLTGIEPVLHMSYPGNQGATRVAHVHIHRWDDEAECRNHMMRRG